MTTTDDEQSTGAVVEAQHDIPDGEMYKLEFADLPDTVRERLNEAGVNILPAKQVSFEEADGHDIAVNIIGESNSYLLTLLETDTGDPYGWCPCERFGFINVCEHLEAAYNWKTGEVTAENEEVASQTYKVVEEKGVLPRFDSSDTE